MFGQTQQALRGHEGINLELLQKVEKLTKEKTEKEEEHVAEIGEVIMEVKASAIVAIWEAKIKVAEDLKNAGSWNVAGGHKALSKLTGKNIDSSQDPALQPNQGGQKTNMAQGVGDHSAALMLFS